MKIIITGSLHGFQTGIQVYQCFLAGDNFFFINSTPSSTEDMYIMYIDIKLFHIISYHELFIAIYIYIMYIAHH